MRKTEQKKWGEIINMEEKEIGIHITDSLKERFGSALKVVKENFFIVLKILITVYSAEIHILLIFLD